MKNQSGKGLIKLIIYFFVMIMFAITLFVCMDMFEIIDVPKKYSIANWINQNFGSTYNVEYNIISNETEDNTNIKKRRIVVDNKTDDEEIVVILPSSNVLEKTEKSKTEQNTVQDKPEELEHFLYYDQLDEYAQIIYRELDKNLDNMKSGTYNVQFGKTFNDLLNEEGGEEILTNSFQLAINALNFDNPNLFYIDISKVYLLTKITQRLWGTTYEVEIGASDGQSYLNDSFANRNEVEQAISKIENEKDYIKSHLGGDFENQIKSVHDYLVENLEYDKTLSLDNIYNIYGALINRTTVCEGYSRAFKSIMDDLNIPCIIVCGTGINSSGAMENHAWNYVNINKKWYAIDVTWDDPIIVGRGFVSSDVFYKYYLKGSEEFFENHTEDGEIVGTANFKYPTLSQKNY